MMFMSPKPVRYSHCLLCVPWTCVILFLSPCLCPYYFSFSWNAYPLSFFSFFQILRVLKGRSRLCCSPSLKLLVSIAISKSSDLVFSVCLFWGYFGGAGEVVAVPLTEIHYIETCQCVHVPEIFYVNVLADYIFFKDNSWTPCSIYLCLFAHMHTCLKWIIYICLCNMSIEKKPYFIYLCVTGAW